MEKIIRKNQLNEIYIKQEKSSHLVQHCLQAINGMIMVRMAVNGMTLWYGMVFVARLSQTR